MTKSGEVQNNILQAIANIQPAFNRFAGDVQIAEKLGVELEDVRMHLRLMKKAGYVTLYETWGGLSAQLTPEGRMILQEPDYFQQQLSSQGGGTIGDTFILSGDFRQAVINIKSILTNVSQAVGALPHAEQSTKDELQQLIEQLNEVLQQAPPDKVEEAEAVAKSAEMLVQTAAKEKPNKTMIQISGDGLKQAAQNLAEVMPAVLTIATQIVATIARLQG